MASRISGFGDIHQGDGSGRGALVRIGNIPLLIQQLITPVGIESKRTRERRASLLYWTGIAGFKGQTAAFSWPIAPNSIGQNM
jgi:hypothetical protein